MNSRNEAYAVSHDKGLLVLFLLHVSAYVKRHHRANKNIFLTK